MCSSIYNRVTETSLGRSSCSQRGLYTDYLYSRGIVYINIKNFKVKPDWLDQLPMSN